ncbi:MAG: prepilin-type N-terminal cleavage/methylation domain-containing protein [Symbiobacteriaceae bacterium]|nr:prepilin-type N-terminal cleavage/methylation domain-containing protein [Symbiobacteriaceae bacterium]
MKRKQQEGFTLIEVMLALAVLLALIVPLFNWIESTAVLGLGDNHERSAMLCLHNMLEEIRAGKHDDLLLQSVATETAEGHFLEYNCKYSLCYLGDISTVESGSIYLSEFRLEVIWEDLSRGERRSGLVIAIARSP